ncbi:MAG TPA: carboxy-S-adenosyl-L-methionine synthase CmoA, partial [Pseudomonas sp.]|nr:carboxy-S-adenosyl-L-methionine synthase CmoA [Pseudomonas sp.]
MSDRGALRQGQAAAFRYNAAPFFQHAAATVSHDPDRLFA